MSEDGKSLTVSFKAPSATGNYTGTLTLASAGAQTLTIALAGVSNPKQTSKTVYKLVSSVSSGKKYLIVSTNAIGSGNALSSSSSNSISNATVTVQSGDDGSGNTIKYIEEPSEYAVFTAGTNGSNMTFANNGYYLYHNSGSLSMSTATTKNNWTVGNNATTLYYSGGGTRYLSYSSGWVIASSSANVYFYEETTLNFDEDDTPTIEVDATSLVFDETNVGESTQKTVTVTATNLTGDIAVVKSGSEYFAIDKTSITPQEDGSASATITVTYIPAAAGQHAGSLILTSDEAEEVTITLEGVATLKYDINRDGEISIADVTALTNIILGKATRESDSEQYDFDVTDVNGDGQTTIADVTALVNIILGK